MDMSLSKKSLVSPDLPLLPPVTPAVSQSTPPSPQPPSAPVTLPKAHTHGQSEEQKRARKAKHNRLKVVKQSSQSQAGPATPLTHASTTNPGTPASTGPVQSTLQAEQGLDPDLLVTAKPWSPEMALQAYTHLRARLETKPSAATEKEVRLWGLQVVQFIKHFKLDTNPDFSWNKGLAPTQRMMHNMYYMVAMWMSMAEGKVTLPQPCTSCSGGKHHPKFKDCIQLLGFLGGACSNCAWKGQIRDCTFHPKAAQRQRERDASRALANASPSVSNRGKPRVRNSLPAAVPSLDEVNSMMNRPRAQRFFYFPMPMATEWPQFLQQSLDNLKTLETGFQSAIQLQQHGFSLGLTRTLFPWREDHSYDGERSPTIWDALEATGVNGGPQTPSGPVLDRSPAHMGAGGMAVSAVDVTSGDNTEESDVLDGSSDASSEAEDEGHDSPGASSEAQDGGHGSSGASSEAEHKEDAPSGDGSEDEEEDTSSDDSDPMEVDGE
jgi:hypothetical protein